MTDKIVALDVGSSNLRAIEAQIKNGVPQILRIAEAPLDSHIVENGVIVSLESLTIAIGRLWKQGRFESKKVFVLASGSSLFNRVLDKLPSAPDADFKKLLPFTVKDRLHFEIEDFYLDSHTLTEYRDPNDPSNPEVFKIALITGVSKEYVDGIIAALQKNNLKPQGVDALPLSLIRAHQITDKVTAKDVVASIELGADVTTIVIHQNHQPIYLHTAPGLGGKFVTERLAIELQMSFPKAEMLKIALSLPEAERENFVRTVPGANKQFETISFKDFSAQEVATAKALIAQEVSNLITHINDIIEDSAGSSDFYVSQISLNGGGAKLSTLAPRLSSELNITTEIAQPFGNERSKKVDDSVFAEQHRFSAVFGLLLGHDDKAK